MRGRPVTVQAGDESARGVARGIDLTGALLVETPQGLKKFFSGEVTVRPAECRHPNTLLVDIGNTRVKWARLVRGRVSRQQAAAHAGWTSEDFARRVIGASRRRIGRVVVVSVAGTRTNALFAVSGPSARRHHAGVLRVRADAPAASPLSTASRGGSAQIGWSPPSAGIGSRGVARCASSAWAPP